MYTFIPERPSAWFDVDDTLIMWKPSEGSATVTIQIPGENLAVVSEVHQKHVDQIKEHAKRGHFVVVWSAGGAAWAKAVVDALGLQEYVHLVCAKPTWFYDDKPASDWLGDDKRTFCDLATGKRIV